MPVSEWTRVRREWLGSSGKVEAFTDRLGELLDGGVGKVEAWDRAFLEMGPPEELLVRVDAPRKGRPPKVKGAEKPREKKPSGEKSAPPVVETGRRCAYDRGVEWVAENLENETVEYGDRVSDSAWAMLQWARGGAISKQSFWTQVYSKIAPAKAERELAAMQADDMRADQNLIARVLRLCQKAEKEAGVR